MFRVAEGLYQTGLFLWSDDSEPPEVDVVLFCAGEDVRMLPPGAESVQFRFDDIEEGLPAERFAALLALCERLAGKRVMTVCAAGENRSGLASALILVARGMTPFEALLKVRAGGRTIVSGYPYPLWNPGFTSQLLAMHD